MPLPFLAVAAAKLFAPKVAKLIGGEKGENIVESVLGVAGNILGITDPAKMMAEVQNNPARLVEVQQAMIGLERDILDEETKRLEAVNETMRDEIKSSDPMVRRWRPFIGYVLGIVLFVVSASLCFGFCYAIISEPEHAPAVMQALAGLVTALMPILGIFCAVVGVSVMARSRDKQTAAGIAPQPGGLAALAGLFGSRNRKEQ